MVVTPEPSSNGPHGSEPPRAGVPTTTLREIVSMLDALAPLRDAESWDNVGLLIGDPKAYIHGVLVTVDCTHAVLQEAVSRGANLTVSYHPVLFSGVKSLKADSVEFQAIRHNIAIYSPHTALDVVDGGTNDWLAMALELEQIAPLRPLGSEGGGDAERSTRRGLGRVGQLSKPMPCREFMKVVGRVLGTQNLLVAGSCDRTVQRIAVGAGAGRSLLDDALKQRVDLYLTGEMPHHDALRAKEAGMVVVCALHSQTERPALATFLKTFREKLAPIPVFQSEIDADPFAFVTP